MRSRSATFINGRPTEASSPASAYLASTVPVTGDTMRHLASRSSTCAICNSMADEFSSIDTALFSSVDNSASNCPPSTFNCASMSSSCLVVAAPSFNRFSTRRRSVCCLAICSRSDAACFPMSGRPLRTEAR